MEWLDFSDAPWTGHNKTHTLCRRFVNFNTDNSIKHSDGFLIDVVVEVCIFRSTPAQIAEYELPDRFPIYPHFLAREFQF